MSKGSTPRPFSVSANEYGYNWDQIFRKDAGAKDGPTNSEAKPLAASDQEITGGTEAGDISAGQVRQPGRPT